MGLHRDYRSGHPHCSQLCGPAACHLLGSGPWFYTSSLCSQVPGAAPSCPGLKTPVGVRGTGRAGGRRVLLLRLLAPGRYQEV